MGRFSAEIRVGLLTIIVGFALLYISLRTVGSPLLGDERYMTFYVNFQTVAGIELKSKVRLSGVEIGYVEYVTLQENHTQVTTALTRKAVIRTDAVATIRTEGLLGEKYIEIVQGTPDAPVLKDGDLLKNSEDPADVSDMLNKLGAALDDIRAVTNSLKNVFGTKEGQNAMGNTLKNIEDASGNMKSILAENREAFKHMISNFEKISTGFAGRAPNIAEDLEKVAAGLREIIENNKDDLSAGVTNLKELTAEFNRILKENRTNLKTTLDNVATASGKIDGVIDSIARMSNSMAEVSGRIEKGEGTIGKLVTDDEIYDHLNNTLAGAEAFINKADEVKLHIGFRDEYQSGSFDFKSFLSLRIAPREDKYYLIELSEDLRRNDLTTTINTVNSLLYTTMIAKRFSDLTIRGGLIESSAGIGVDLHLGSDQVTLTTEMFNFSGYDHNTENPQVKAHISWSFHKYMYLYMGGDELANDYYRTFLIGGGLLFDEDDLKLAIGLL